MEVQKLLTCVFTCAQWKGKESEVLYRAMKIHTNLQESIKEKYKSVTWNVFYNNKMWKIVDKG